MLLARAPSKMQNAGNKSKILGQKDRSQHGSGQAGYPDVAKKGWKVIRVWEDCVAKASTLTRIRKALS
jgi:hypothetical protein